jgi:hypothetical protein
MLVFDFFLWHTSVMAAQRNTCNTCSADQKPQSGKHFVFYSTGTIVKTTSCQQLIQSLRNTVRALASARNVLTVLSDHLPSLHPLLALAHPHRHPAYPAALKPFGIPSRKLTGAT